MDLTTPWKLQEANREIERLEGYEAKWNGLQEMLGELEHVPDDGTPNSTVDGFIGVWQKQKDEIKDLKEEVKDLEHEIEEFNDYVNDILGDEG